MKELLFLAHRLPWPPDRGDRIRSWHLLRHLAGFARVHLACFADTSADAARLPELRAALGGRLGEAHVEVRRTGRATALARALVTGRPVSLAAFESGRLRAFAHDMLGRVDAVFAFSGQMAQFVSEAPGPRFVMDFVDMDSVKFAAYAETAAAPLARLYRREAELLFAFERKIAARAAASLFVSKAEASLFRARTGLPDICALPNGVDLGFFDPAASFAPLAERGEGPLIVFTGQMDYPPNVDAVRWFAAEVLPLVPEARLAIVGRDPGPAVRRLASPRILVTGAVPDVRPWLAAADAVVAPLRIARGIQNKVLEAMAMARPVVASAAAFEGIEAEPGRELLIATGAQEMAAALRGLLADPAQAASLGAAARERVERAYRWEARLAPLEEMLFPVARAAA